MKSLLLTVAAATLGLTGCASNLNVWDAGGTPVKGVPFRTMQTYIVTGTFTQHDKEETCRPAQFVVYETLPTGPIYYANVDTAQLAKTEFTVDIKNDGTLSKIGMNSEPASDAIESVAGAISSIAGIAGIGGGAKAAGAAPAAPAPAKGPLCNAGAVVEKRELVN